MAADDNSLGTGILPGDFAEAARRHARHFARYLLVEPLARGKIVLDAACGGGFGSAYLARVATAVLGLDLDEDMLAWARGHFRADNLSFRSRDLHEPVPGGPFDLLVCLETLEHVRDPRLCLANLVATLRSQGVAVVSVPNGDKERRSGGKDFHPNQFSAGQFRALLAGCFADVQPFSQVRHKGWRHYARKLLGRKGRRVSDYRYRPGLLDDAKTWICICRGPRSGP